MLSYTCAKQELRDSVKDIRLMCPAGRSGGRHWESQTVQTKLEMGAKGCTVNKPDETIRVLLADDHPVTRAGIRATLDEAPDVKVVGEARDGVAAKRMVTELGPDILLLDLVMPGLRASEIEAWVRANCPETVTLVLTAHDRDAYLSEMIEAGVAGFLDKGEKCQGLVDAIRHAARGEVLITKEQLARANRWRREVGDRWESLTARERETLELVAKGFSNKQIAKVLGVTNRTVEKHMSNVLDKLSLSSRTEAALWAARNIVDL
jgi:NarL family two-component system response regulator LiaR